MAADYWNSTQKNSWTLGRDALTQARRSLEGDGSLAQQFPLPEMRLLSIFFQQQLLKLTKRLNLRQAPLATAQVYLRRYYIKVPIRQTNPYLLITAALYIACKIEESPQNIRHIVGEARTLWPDYVGPDIASVGETEFRLINTMGCDLVLHHPYRTVKYLESLFQLPPEEASLAWGTVNDSYLTDLPLLYPPHVVAWAAMFIVLALKPGQGPSLGHADMAQAVANALREGQEPAATAAGAGMPVGSHQMRLHRFLESLAESEVDLAATSDAVQEIISLYLLWENAYREKEVREQIARFIKARGLAK